MTVSYEKASVPIICFAYDSIACAFGIFGIVPQDTLVRVRPHSFYSFTFADSDQNGYSEHNHSENSLK